MTQKRVKSNNEVHRTEKLQERLAKAGVMPTVYVGMSGGVDSSVSAALLNDIGCDVVGVFIKVWHPDFAPCDWKQDREDAMKVCARLGIPFRELDLEDVYKREVIDYMIAEYKAGRTPNPDIMCNRQVKFGAFLEWAKNEGAHFVATGHYACVAVSTTREISRSKHQTPSKFQIQKSRKGNRLLQDTVYTLRFSADRRKDQTYFLWTLTQQDLEHTVFPVGEFRKKEVRDIARAKGLTTAEKKDSQGLCFVGNIDMRAFLKEFLPVKAGDVHNTDGEKVGTHDGVHFYTIGQRHGFDIVTKSPDSNPHYIIHKDIKRNRLTVSGQYDNMKYRDKEIVLEKVNWIAEKAPREGAYQARLRHGQELQHCTLLYKDGKTVITFKEKQAGVACGQSCVLYAGRRCLGGGIVKSKSSLTKSGKTVYNQHAGYLV